MKRVFCAISIFLLAFCLRAEFKMFVDAGGICDASKNPLESGTAALLVGIQEGAFENFSLISGTELREGKIFGGFLVLAVAKVSDGKCALNADIELGGGEFLRGGNPFALLVSGGTSGSENKVKSGSKYLIFRNDSWVLSSENRGVFFYDAVSVSAGGKIEDSKLLANIDAEPSEEDLSGIRIEAQPRSVETYEGKKVEFSAAARDENGKKLIYAWEVDKLNGKGWVKAGSSKNVLKVSANLKSDGFKYRLKIQNEKNGNPVYTDEAVLTVRKNPKITQKPKSLTVFENGENSGFAVGADGYDVKYQWQEYVKAPNEKGKLVWVWQNIEGAVSPIFVPPNADYLSDSKKYRCMVYNGGKILYTSGVAFTVRQAAKIEGISASQNKENADFGNLYEEYDITLTAKAAGYKIKYQWQVLDENNVWTDVKKATKSTLKLSKPTVAEYGGKTYRCRVYNDGSSDYSNAAALQISPCLAPKSLKGRKLEVAFGGAEYLLAMSSASSGTMFDSENAEFAKASLSYKRLSPTKASMTLSFKHKNQDGILQKTVFSDKKFDFAVGELANAKIKLLPDENL
ncbi:MAG: hypothetical protein J6R08_06755 [Opitutales bacterium]|nr:hypothetical protein [Opitutales bacterium]